MANLYALDNPRVYKDIKPDLANLEKKVQTCTFLGFLNNFAFTPMVDGIKQRCSSWFNLKKILSNKKWGLLTLLERGGGVVVLCFYLPPDLSSSSNRYSGCDYLPMGKCQDSRVKRTIKNGVKSFKNVGFEKKCGRKPKAKDWYEKNRN
ncbi:hypothetical protein BpHYR1_029507 [Brachionus plicatilis]|uniref:RNA-directed DNA polymerase from mobile element jockey-like n=1 Tax=Brachionus plicatilis TaxID=10195 RepID=A0A3M7RPH2_BRAPC|nr:hypothetical protein BpHYR1_029507 [Brachionus plicatilis]